MTTTAIDTNVLAALLEYPWEKPQIADRALAGKLKPLVRFIEKHSVEELQDVFTSTFDLTPSTPPYLAYHMHGESYRRGAVMSNLRALYHTYEVDEAGELPDHLGNILKLMAKAGADEALDELIRVELLPGLDRLREMAAKDERSNPYRALLDVAREAMEERIK